MSHFTVLVIGEDYEGQLAPYNEEIRVDPYPRYEKDPGWLRRVYKGEHDGADPPSDQALVDFLNEHWDDESYFVDDKGIYQMSTYNPKSKWDWYQVGGRWSGYFKVRQGVLVGSSQKGPRGLMGSERGNDADVLMKGDVDVEAMRDEAGADAGRQWDKAHRLFEGLEEAQPWSVFYERARAECEALPDDEARETWDKAREDYAKQPRVKAMREARDDFGFYSTPDDFQVPRDEFVQEARDRAIAPYAYLKDGEWFAPGEMGWWGVSSENEDEKKAFVRHFNEMFDALPDDTPLTLVDCHI